MVIQRNKNTMTSIIELVGGSQQKTLLLLDFVVFHIHQQDIPNMIEH